VPPLTLNRSQVGWLGVGLYAPLLSACLSMRPRYLQEITGWEDPASHLQRGHGLPPSVSWPACNNGRREDRIQGLVFVTGHAFTKPYLVVAYVQWHLSTRFDGNANTTCLSGRESLGMNSNSYRSVFLWCKSSKQCNGNDGESEKH
jgi:hypothetical protein